jgi:hypothetical protein
MNGQGCSSAGLNQALVQPGVAHLTLRWPLPPGVSTARRHSHGVQPTVTRPGPQGWPAWHADGYDHQAGMRASIGAK